MNSQRAYTARIIDSDGDGIRVLEHEPSGISTYVCSREHAAVLIEQIVGRTAAQQGIIFTINQDEEKALPYVRFVVTSNLRETYRRLYTENTYWSTMIFVHGPSGVFSAATRAALQKKLEYLRSNARRCDAYYPRESADDINNPEESPDVAEHCEIICDCIKLHGYTFLTPFTSNVPETPYTGRTVKFSYSPTVEIIGGVEQIHATAVYKHGRLVVQKGSEAAISGRGGNLVIQALIRNNVLQVKENKSGYTFTQDYAFNSPFLAATIISGRSTNGPLEWVTESGMFLQEFIQSNELDRLV